MTRVGDKIHGFHTLQLATLLFEEWAALKIQWLGTQTSTGCWSNAKDVNSRRNPIDTPGVAMKDTTAVELEAFYSPRCPLQFWCTMILFFTENHDVNLWRACISAYICMCKAWLLESQLFLRFLFLDCRAQKKTWRMGLFWSPGSCRFVKGSRGSKLRLQAIYPFQWNDSC